MSRLFIHVGTHKTGTTAIQRSLKYTSSRDGSGFRYIASKDVFKSISKIKLSSDADSSERLAKELYDVVKSEVEQAADSNDTFVISNEGFSGNPLSGYANASKIARILYSGLSEIFSEIKIVIYLRRQDAFVESLYTQYIHQGNSWSFEEFLSKFGESAFDWSVLCSHYEKIFGQDHVIVRPYDKSQLVDGDLIADFASILGSVIKKSPDKKINQGYSREALEVARICNSVFSNEEKKKLRSLLQSTNSKQPFANYNFFSSVQRVGFLRGYLASNNLLAQKLNLPYLFNESVAHEDDDGDSKLDSNLLAVVFMRALINR